MCNLALNCIKLNQMKIDADRFPGVLGVVPSGKGRDLFLIFLIDCVNSLDAQLILEIDLRNRTSALGYDTWIRYIKLS
jgi:hypothetical protein